MYKTILEVQTSQKRLALKELRAGKVQVQKLKVAVLSPKVLVPTSDSETGAARPKGGESLKAPVGA
jgi:hypothetical protein